MGLDDCFGNFGGGRGKGDCRGLVMRIVGLEELCEVVTFFFLVVFSPCFLFGGLIVFLPILETRLTKRRKMLLCYLLIEMLEVYSLKRRFLIWGFFLGTCRCSLQSEPEVSCSWEARLVLVLVFGIVD